jgi:hypothetical protein
LSSQVLIHTSKGQDLFINTTKDQILATGQEIDLPKKVFVKRGDRNISKDSELLSGLMKSYGLGDIGVMGRGGIAEGLGVRMEAGMERKVVDLG